MVVWVRNFQRCVVLNEWLLKLQGTFLLQALGAGKFDVSIVCMEEKEIRTLNWRYRGVGKLTDVLSFPYHEVGELSCVALFLQTVRPSDTMCLECFPPEPSFKHPSHTQASKLAISNQAGHN